jgi:hypothetical protein
VSWAHNVGSAPLPAAVVVVLAVGSAVLAVGAVGTVGTVEGAGGDAVVAGVEGSAGGAGLVVAVLSTGGEAAVSLDPAVADPCWSTTGGPPDDGTALGASTSTPTSTTPSVAAVKPTRPGASDTSGEAMAPRLEPTNIPVRR